MFVPGRATDTDVTLQLVLDDQPFRVHLSRGALEIERGELPDADVTVRCSPTLLAGIVYQGLPVADAQADGSLVLTGDPAALGALVDSVQLPEPLPV
jgi:hypothetical protein